MINENYKYVDVPKNCISAKLPICPLCSNTNSTEIPLQTIKLCVDPPYRTECHDCQVWWESYKTKVRV